MTNGVDLMGDPGTKEIISLADLQAASAGARTGRKHVVRA